MSFQPGNNVLTQNAGLSPENLEVPTITTYAPSSSNIAAPGKRWIYLNNAEYVNLGNSSVGGVLASNWVTYTAASSDLETLSDQSGTTVTPSSNNIQLNGTSSQIQTTAGSAEITFSLIGPYTPATYTAHGVLIGEGSSSIVAVSPSSTAGQALVSQGATSDPHYGTVVVAGGGTGATTLTGILTGNGTSAVTASTVTQHGVLVAGASNAVASLTVGTNGQVLLGSTGANPAFGTLTTSTGINYTPGAASLAIDLKQGGYNVNTASTGGSLVAQNAYTVTQSTQTSFALPATAAVGDRILIASATGNTSGWIITQGASQEIWAGTNHTTNGATGTLAGAIHTSVEIMCVVANTEFIVVGGSGLTGLTFT